MNWKQRLEIIKKHVNGIADANPQDEITDRCAEVVEALSALEMALTPEDSDDPRVFEAGE